MALSSHVRGSLKLCWWHGPVGPSTALYLLMGWVAVITALPLDQSVPLGGLSWLLAEAGVQ